MLRVRAAARAPRRGRSLHPLPAGGRGLHHPRLAARLAHGGPVPRVALPPERGRARQRLLPLDGARPSRPPTGPSSTAPSRTPPGRSGDRGRPVRRRARAGARHRLQPLPEGRHPAVPHHRRGAGGGEPGRGRPGRARHRDRARPPPGGPARHHQRRQGQPVRLLQRRAAEREGRLRRGAGRARHPRRRPDRRGAGARCAPSSPATPGARIEVREFEQGPPVDAPVAIRVLADDPAALVRGLGPGRGAARLGGGDALRAQPGPRSQERPAGAHRPRARRALRRGRARRRPGGAAGGGWPRGRDLARGQQRRGARHPPHRPARGRRGAPRRRPPRPPGARPALRRRTPAGPSRWPRSPPWRSSPRRPASTTSTRPAARPSPPTCARGSTPTGSRSAVLARLDAERWPAGVRLDRAGRASSRAARSPSAAWARPSSSRRWACSPSWCSSSAPSAPR